MIKRILELPAGAGEQMTWSSEDEFEEQQKIAKKKERNWHSKAVSAAESEAALDAIANGPQIIATIDERDERLRVAPPKAANK